ncbi:S-adenosyl-L-methionine-dependent methyltransferase [Artomyces pyxidatus]|uniref:S-adenosyl-L-methionine-dependent methyltransferase n=1 Tax=Artomyces pyxidatus TaxID=48021 RepID=A0ACB8SLT6_9AGAM|nr:S-adenosyl-L-methionine-dependent methyltransferase [Artomyces pyxidatus]
MDDNASDSSSNLTEVRSCEFPAYFKEHAGRLFHFHGISPYPLPVDGYEWKRLDAIHIVLRQILGRNYDGPVAEVLAPDGLERPKMVVDLCNGTGLWVMDMAREFSHVQFRGLDLVPIATQYPLDNVRFELADVTQRLRFANNSVDFVHARMTSLGVHDYPKLLREVARVLRPGGLFLSCEFGAYAALHPDHPSHANPAEYIPHTARFYRAVTDGIE